MPRIEPHRVVVLCDSIANNCCSLQGQSKVIPTDRGINSSLELLGGEGLLEQEVYEVLTATIYSYREILFGARKLTS